MVSDNWEEIVEELVVKLVENEDEFEGAIAVRFRVFVAEQSIPPEEELDEDDATAIHAIALVHGQVVGTGTPGEPGRRRRPSWPHGGGPALAQAGRRWPNPGIP